MKNDGIYTHKREVIDKISLMNKVDEPQKLRHQMKQI